MMPADCVYWTLAAHALRLMHCGRRRTQSAGAPPPSRIGQMKKPLKVAWIFFQKCKAILENNLKITLIK